MNKQNSIFDEYFTTLQISNLKIQTLTDSQYFKNKIFQLGSNTGFNETALELFQYQVQHCQVYADYLGFLNIDAKEVQSVEQIPFLPISFFKTHKVISRNFDPRVIFTSSGTTGMRPSQHFVSDLSFYHRVAFHGFQHFFGQIEDYCVLGLLPSYLERKGSSLVEMVQYFINLSNDKDSGFFLHEWEKLHNILIQKIRSHKKVLLIGVTFGLLDFAEKYKLPPNDMLIMETGGMKGRRKEMVRSEVHTILKERLSVKNITSEYGMTELLSQAYATREGLFKTPPWMQVSIRQTDDPFSLERHEKTGGINIIDLANVDSCAFIETQDLGRKHADGSFEVLGRFDNAEIRGCNLMVVE